MGSIALLLGVTYLVQGPVVIDRIAVIAGKHVIKTSDIERDLRVTAFLNREPLAITPDRKRKAADRLVDQAIIRDEIATGEYHRASDSDAKTMLDQIRRDRFGGSEARLSQAIEQYGLTESQLREYLLWQLTVLRFIDERFRPGVLIDDEDVRKYYEQHLNELKRKYPTDNSFAALEPKIRNLLEGERINQEFEAWLDGARKRLRIEYIQGAFG
jgi:hypothetical protein